MGTLRGVRGRGVGDYTSLNRPYQVFIMCIKAPYPSSPYPPKGPYEFKVRFWAGVRGRGLPKIVYDLPLLCLVAVCKVAWSRLEMLLQ